ncbi:MAG: exo-alpha-sialidase [Candidatus Solibacter usitatus]|nr:exo-alpha-sialidase [Candidatus Solibacter usitatus]
MKARWITLSLLACALTNAQIVDRRNIKSGDIIPDEGYSDQPYIVKTADGAWLCVITTGPGLEGAGGQHVVTRRSTDRGKTWSQAVDVEPSNGPEASYAVLLKVPYGRIYVFYNHNTDNLRQVIGDKPAYKDGWVRRVDSLGHFVFKFSDDHGRSWSAKRYDILQRDFEIDLKNPYEGTIKFFWNVGRAFSHGGAGYVPLHKVGGFGEGFFTSSEGVLLRSRNMLTERDPSQLEWETWPEGEVGLRTPAGGGPIAEEQSFSVLSDGSFFCVYRTIDGHSAFSYSRDAGRSWEPPQYMRYADGRLMKHPRAANFAWRAENGKFLYWFHNHGGRFIREHPRRRTIAYEDRNPVWLVGGVEADSPRGKIIRWSQPEIVLYDDDPLIRMSYPDLVEEGGKYYFTETQKDVARVHEIDAALLHGLWSQFDAKATPAKAGLLVNLPAAGASTPTEVAAPALPLLLQRSRRADFAADDLRAGFSIDVWMRFESGQTLLDNRGPDGKGFALRTSTVGSVELILNDGQTENRWTSDPGMLATSKTHHIVAIVDGGPKIITFVIDGKLNDGGDARQFGWGRFSPNLRGANGGNLLRIGNPVQRLRLYNRALRTSEAIANFKSPIL